VQRLSLGATRDFRISGRAVFGVGVVVQQHFTSDALKPIYEGDPQEAMVFARLRIG